MSHSKIKVYFVPDIQATKVFQTRLCDNGQDEWKQIAQFHNK